MNAKESKAWETILGVVDLLPEKAAAYLQGYAQGMADANKAKEGAA